MKTARAIIVTLVLTVAARSAHAQLPTSVEVYQYRAVNRELTEVLRAFASDQRLNIVIDEAVEPKLINEEIELPPEQFLNYITGKNGLVWYYDGTSVYINRSSDLQTQAFRLRYTTPARVTETMQILNAYSDNFPFRLLDPEKVILVVGPPRLIEMTRFAVETLESGGEANLMNEVSIAVFPLTFASATDQTLEFQGQSVQVPGVATILESLISGQPIQGKLSTLLPRNLPGLTGYGLDRFSQTPEARLFSRQPSLVGETDVQPDEYIATREDLATQINPDGTVEESDQVRVINTASITPTIRADPRLNAIVVRDLPERMESYRQLIHSLDQPSGIIEITARIIDITKRGVFEWGLPYDFQWDSGGQARQFSMQLTTTDTANLAVTLLKDETVQFMQQIKALEQDGYARVASRPSILTLDNVQAEINNSETFFVRVEGDFEVDLFDVSVGTKLNITPRIIEKDAKKLIKLSVQIDDGAVLEQTVDEIPRIRNDSITTQALLSENQSLLIGGLFREEKSTVESRIPVLGNLPGVGFLFRTEEFNTSRVERVILIEPRIVTLASLQGGDIPPGLDYFPDPVPLDADELCPPLPACPPGQIPPVGLPSNPVGQNRQGAQEGSPGKFPVWASENETSVNDVRRAEMRVSSEESNGHLERASYSKSTTVQGSSQITNEQAAASLNMKTLGGAHPALQRLEANSPRWEQSSSGNVYKTAQIQKTESTTENRRVPFNLFRKKDSDEQPKSETTGRRSLFRWKD
ncbi:type III secretion system outer membrane ring subunit SctC [Thalassoglobus sp. JC818]|uniref:type III secretion system outer membrane ring subunit SctC n=1 Tax=Thalassoglobus sp. JC818 TaxID=3232136 RepID=UPI003457FF01